VLPDQDVICVTSAALLLLTTLGHSVKRFVGAVINSFVAGRPQLEIQKLSVEFGYN
jgi:hypothetical protein